MSAGQGYSGVATKMESLFPAPDRSDPRRRLVSNWPLDAIAMDVPVVAEDFKQGSSWPPQRCVRASERLQTMADLRRGDLSKFISDTPTVVPNLFARLAQRMAELGTQTLTPGHDLAVAGPMLIDDAVTYGRVYAVQWGEETLVVDARRAWRGGIDGQLWVVEPYVSPMSSDGAPDRVRIRHIDQETQTGTEAHREWAQASMLSARGTIGKAMSEGEPGDAGWGMGDVPPVDGGWGFMVYGDMVPLVGQIASILTDTSRVITQAQPQLILGIAKGDMVSAQHDLLHPDTTPERWGDDDQYTDNSPRFRKAIGRVAQQSVLWTPEELTETRWLVPEIDAWISGALSEVEMLSRFLRIVAPVAGAVERDEGEIASGTAAQQFDRVAVAMAASLHEVAVSALVEAGIAVDWPAPTADTPEPASDSAPQPEPTPSEAA